MLRNLRKLGRLHDMESEPRIKDYEIGYILSPSIPEERVLTCAGNITGLIEQVSGIVKHVEEPKKKRLVYPIQKNWNAYFGWTTFRMATGNLHTFEKKIKMLEGLMRHLVLEEELNKKPAAYRVARPRSPVDYTAPSHHRDETDEKLDLEALDKKLEEILGK